MSLDFLGDLDGNSSLSASLSPLLKSNQLLHLNVIEFEFESWITTSPICQSKRINVSNIFFNVKNIIIFKYYLKMVLNHLSQL